MCFLVYLGTKGTSWFYKIVYPSKSREAIVELTFQSTLPNKLCTVSHLMIRLIANGNIYIYYHQPKIGVHL